MSLTGKPLAEVTLVDLQALIDDGIPEGATLDYKEALPSAAPAADGKDARREFLRDVTAFANTAGGHMIFGMAEAEGRPTEFKPILGVDADGEILRLENSLRDSVSPRLSGVGFHEVPVEGGGFVLVARIPDSFSKPHRVEQKDYGYYGRNSRGRFQLDVPQTRAAFLAAEGLADRIRRFREERLATILSGAAPFSKDADFAAENGLVVLHFIPLEPLSDGALLGITNQYDAHVKLAPLFSQGYPQLHHNFDGVLMESRRSYLQMFRNGSVETVDCYLLEPNPVLGDQSPTKNISHPLLENEVIASVKRYIKLLSEVGGTPPVVLMLSLLRVRGYRIQTRAFRGESGRPIDRDNLLLPDVLLDSLDIDVAAAMRPFFDRIWNACGYPFSPSYDQDGTRRPE